MCYKQKAFIELAQKSIKNLSGTCPLIEDEAIVWAWDEIQEMRELLKFLVDNDSINDSSIDREVKKLLTKDVAIYAKAD